MEDNLTRSLKIPQKNLVVCKAEPWSRIWGKIIDSLIESGFLVIIILIIFDLIKETSLNESTRIITILFVIYQVFSLFLNLIVPTITKGQTLGKMAMKTRIIHVDGDAANIIIYLIRQSFFTVIALVGQIDVLSELANGALFIIYIICVIGIFSDEHGRTLQDKFAKTIVVNDNTYKTYREKAFHEIDHPMPEFVESNQDETLYNETSITDEEETLNQSITTEEEII